MRVALIVHQFPSPEHPYIFEWVKELLDQGVLLTVIAERMSEPPGTKFWSLDSNFRKRMLRINFIDNPSARLFFHSAFIALLHPRRLIQMLRTLWRTEKHSTKVVLRKAFEYLPLLLEEFDLIHFNAPQLAIRRFELKEVFQAKSIVSFRGQDFTFYPDRYDRLLEEADHLHFIAQFLVDQARERGYDGSRHSLIYPMVDINFYTPSEAVEQAEKDRLSPYIIFSAGRLEWVKGWEFALQAVALLIERGWDVQYYVAGDGELKDLVVYTASQLGIAGYVHILGWQSPEQVRNWMLKSDLYLLASVEEAFNNSVLQAQACGLPVVCSDEGGLPENIEDGVTGLLASRRDAWDMSDKIALLLSSPERRLQLGQAGIRRTREEFTLEEISSRFKHLYEELIGNETISIALR